jgi:hypothetical protein
MAELSQHPDVVDLAEYAEGLLDDSRRAAVEQHVRGCPDCSRTLADLTALPGALAGAPLPPLPVDVAARLDRAIAAESQARASGWSGTAQATVTPLRPKRRWLAPVVAAAAVIGAVAIAVPVLNSQDSEDDAGAAQTADEEFGASGGSDDRSAEEENGIPPDNAIPNAAPAIDLSSDSFGRDVIDAYYHDAGALKASRRLALLESQSPREDHYNAALGKVSNPCAAQSGPGVRIDDVTYDGESARLLRQEAGEAVDVIAFTCDAGEPNILDAVTLRPRP